FPPILDYPNHYARIWLLSGGIGDQPFPEIYAVDWNRTFTNVGIDVLANRPASRIRPAFDRNISMRQENSRPQTIA
ncbi:hypothetical protein ACC710_38080, partial [Rhizobium ruizarguesonis]